MPLTIESDSVRAYLSMLQGVISRLTNNSASCKAWCVTILSALLVLAMDKNKPMAILVGMLPIGSFFLLDAYYLSLERDFRNVYDSFVQRLRDNGDLTSIYELKPKNSGPKHRIQAIVWAIFSLSILPFYGALVIALLITKRLVTF